MRGHSEAYRWERAKALSGWVVAVILATSLFGAVAALNPSFSTVIQPGSQVSEASFVVFTDGASYFARNGKTGGIDYSGTNFTVLMVSTLAAVTSGGGGLVILKVGTYTTYARILVPSNVEIRGESQSKTIVTFSQNVGVLGVWEMFNGISNVTIAHMTIDGGYPTLTTNGAVYIRIAKDIRVQDMTFRNFGVLNSPINIYQAVGETSSYLSRISVRNNVFFNVNYGPIFAVPQSVQPATFITFSDNTVYGGAGADPSGTLPFGNIVGLEVSRNKFYNVLATTANTAIVELYNVKNAILSGNIFDGSGTTGAKVAGIRVNRGESVVISNNVMTDVANGLFQAAIMVWPINGNINRGTTITGNTIRFTANPTNQMNGIVVQDANTHTTIVGNAIDGGNFANVNAGIYLHGDSALLTDVDNSTITGNSIVNVTVGINLTWTNETAVTGNTVDSSSYGLRFASAVYSDVSGNVFHSADTCVTDTTSGSYNVVQYNDVRFCGTPAIALTGISPIVRHNIGYTTEAYGTATISASTSVTFNHGLVAAPLIVFASFSSSATGAYTWTATSTQITVSVVTSGTYTVYWYAQTWKG